MSAGLGSAPPLGRTSDFPRSPRCNWQSRWSRCSTGTSSWLGSLGCGAFAQQALARGR
jgi:hypothetical protein